MLLPGNCPRIVYTRTNEITDEDQNKFFGLTQSHIVVTVEIDWYERIKSTTIYRYRLPSDTFRLFDEYAGYYISTQTVKPVEIEPFNNLLDQLIKLDIEVRFTPNLYQLRNAILTYYFKASVVSGDFGTGTGAELYNDVNSETGSYEPILVPISEVANYDVRPKHLAQILHAASHCGN
ncbi:MAG: hypothetical protein JWN30_942 [Bacilli bacterium]|nr:hypothetical protein [Bacilli bacterium]